MWLGSAEPHLSERAPSPSRQQATFPSRALSGISPKRKP